MRKTWDWCRCQVKAWTRRNRLPTAYLAAMYKTCLKKQAMTVLNLFFLGLGDVSVVGHPSTNASLRPTRAPGHSSRRRRCYTYHRTCCQSCIFALRSAMAATPSWEAFVIYGTQILKAWRLSCLLPVSLCP